MFNRQLYIDGDFSFSYLVHKKYKDLCLYWSDHNLTIYDIQVKSTHFEWDNISKDIGLSTNQFIISGFKYPKNGWRQSVFFERVDKPFNFDRCLFMNLELICSGKQIIKFNLGLVNCQLKNVHKIVYNYQLPDVRSQNIIMHQGACMLDYYPFNEFDWIGDINEAISNFGINPTLLMSVMYIYEHDFEYLQDDVKNRFKIDRDYRWEDYPYLNEYHNRIKKFINCYKNYGDVIEWIKKESGWVGYQKLIK